ncbi:oxidoreductase domain protein [Thioploca ingrica]|uniref:Oxidoreductase domain protein n=1 Tax=Thioploca ingrica TaxID=40754 RepID=A0A090AJF5_9GAMM|nr:oxidoreductase domain protein [Thioploca ingrica]
MKDIIQVGVIGYGYWGPNLVRNFMGVAGAKVIAVSDLNPESLPKVQSRYPSVQVTTRTQDLLENPQIDAIVIATPVSTHFDLAWAALQAGKHVFVEKPFTATAEQAIQLIKEAARRNLVLMVDHTFIYTGAVRKIRELVTQNDLGEIYYYDSVRINLGLFQPDVNVIWDLAVHDLAIMDYVLSPLQPIAVSATGMKHISGGLEDIAYLTLFFNNNLIAHLHVNWLAPVKIRYTLLGGSKRMLVYNDLEPSETVKVYDKGITVTANSEQMYRMRIDYRAGDMWSPQVDRTEALQTEALHFIYCIQNNESPITDGKAGLRVVRILEAATQSLFSQGNPIELTSIREPEMGLDSPKYAYKKPQVVSEVAASPKIR